MPVCGRDVLVMQGDKDGSVDWKYNINLIREKIPKARIEMIAGANHELFNEAAEYKNTALEYVVGYFK